MQILKDFWNDDAGAVLTAEVVMVGTIAVLGSVVGLNLAATAVDEELKEYASAIRSLDQSYGYVGHQSCRSWTAGSYYRQPSVEQSLHELCGEGTANIGLIQQQIDAVRHAQDAIIVAPEHDAPQPPPNELPTPAPAR